MVKFCGRCGTKLDRATGLCPNCDADKLNERVEKPELLETSTFKQNMVPKSEKLLNTEKAKKKHKAAKKEKSPQWTNGKKIRNFFLKLILIVMFLSMLVVVVARALVYFEVINIPDVSSIIGNLIAENRNGSIAFDNGNYVFTPTEEHISYDADSNVLFFNNQLIVYTFSELSGDEMNKLADLVEGEIVGHISGGINAFQIRVKESTLDELESMTMQLMENTDVLYAGYDYPIQLSSTEVDSNPWSTDCNNPIAGRSEEDNPAGNDWWAEAIGAYTAWNDSDECLPIKVGIIDTGFDADHEDLSGRITFLQNYSTNSKDDHGTHVAGIIGANNNTVGIRGIADSANLICVDWNPTNASNDYISSGEYIIIIKQLVENGTKVINNSWGAYYMSKWKYAEELYKKDKNVFKSLMAYYLAINITGEYDSYLEYIDARSNRTGLECTVMMIELMLNGYKDFLIVESAGNDRMDAHRNSFFCAIDADVYNMLSESVREKLSKKDIDYNAIDERILIVGAVQNKCNKHGYRMCRDSNFGSNVDICAPGENIFSTLVDNKYGELCGTSMAAPMVAGSAAFVWSLNPQLSATKVRDILLKNTRVQAYGVGDGASCTYPMLNVGAAAEAVVSDMRSDFDKDADLDNTADAKKDIEEVVESGDMNLNNLYAGEYEWDGIIKDNLFSGHFANMSAPMGIRKGVTYDANKKFAIKASYDVDDPVNGAYYFLLVDMLGNVYDMFPISKYASEVNGWLLDDVFYNTNGRTVEVLRQGSDITDNLVGEQVSLLDIVNDENGIHFLTCKTVFDSPYKVENTSTDYKLEIWDDTGKSILSFYENELVNKYGMDLWTHLDNYHLINLGNGIYLLKDWRDESDCGTDYFFLDLNRNKVFGSRTKMATEYRSIETDGDYILIPQKGRDNVWLYDIETENIVSIENVSKAHGLGEGKFFSDIYCYSVQGSVLFSISYDNLGGKIIEAGTTYHDGKTLIIIDDGKDYQSRTHKYKIGFMNENGNQINISKEIIAQEVFCSYISSMGIYAIFSDKGTGVFLFEDGAFQEENVYYGTKSDYYYGVLDQNGDRYILRYGVVDALSDGIRQSALYGCELFEIY